jgi:hypothetical protein
VLLMFNRQHFYIRRKAGALRTVAGLMILGGLMLNLGCQTYSVDPRPTEKSTASSTIDPPSTAIPTEAGMQNLIDKAMADLAQRLAVSMNEIVLLEAESVTWPDGSLGCPQEGMLYAQVLTPGYLIRLQWGGQEFEYHASRGTTVIFCENPTPPVPGTPADT